MSFLKVALLQMTAYGHNQAANLTKGEAFCYRARAAGADIALFPEMWNMGYTFHDPAQPEGLRDAWPDQAISRDDPFIQHYQRVAQELDMAIALTYLEKWPGGPRNTVSLIDRQGQIALTYAKVHTCDFDIEATLTPGDDFYVANLDTAQGKVRIGAMIGFDREFPESARILMLKGAELILIPNAGPLETNRLGQIQTRAFENMAGLALTNYAAPQQNGHSVAFDGIAFNPGESNRDMRLVEAGEAEDVYLAEFDLARLRAYRQHEVWGNAFRKPRSYQPLTSPTVQYPFIRMKAKR